MGSRLFVGNLSYTADETELRNFFGEDVAEVKIIIDRDTGKSKGFGFIDMVSNEAAQEAMDRLNEALFDGRPLRIDMAKPRENSGGGGGKRFDGGNRNGGGGYRGREGSPPPIVEERGGRGGGRGGRGGSRKYRDEQGDNW